MEDKLRRYVDELFNGAVPTRKAAELKEEMIQNLNDKFKDLLAEGKTPEAAYNISIAGIGDVGGLLKELEKESVMPDVYDLEASRRRSAMFTAIAVMTYILSILPLIMLNQFGYMYANNVGLPVLFIMVAGATGLLVYDNMTKPKRYKGSDTVVEEFREWQSETQTRKALRSSISSAFWSLLVVVYIIVSFATRSWHVTWVLFVLGAAVEAFINIFFTLKGWGVKK